MKTRNAILALAILTLAFSGCATAPAVSSPDDCLVVIPCKTVNNGGAGESRYYQFTFTGDTKPVKANSDYAFVVLHQPGVETTGIESWVGSDARGKQWKDEVKILMPYEPGRLVIADFVFVRTFTKKSANETLSDIDIQKLSAYEKSSLLDKFKADSAFAKWFK